MPMYSPVMSSSTLETFFFFECADTLGLDKDLVGDRFRPEDAPRGAVIAGFFNEKTFANIYYRFVFCCCVAQFLL